VIHGAAESFVDKSISDPQIFTKTNVVGTQVIIDACVKYDVEKLIYISTDEVYGQLISESSPSWSESSQLNPRNPYSASKASGELLIKAAGETFGLNYNITRSCNNYGPRQNRRNLIPKIIGNILSGKDVPIYGKGEQIRDWIHVQDNCLAILKVLENGDNKEIYNISAKQEFSNIEIFNQICNLMKDHNGYKLLKFVEDRKGHDFRYSVSNVKSIGWEPTFNFKSGIEHTINWYFTNQWVYR
jgi:dTDP-glucose 4,6-dehydratase